MKLYPILFEAAKTAEEAMQRGLGLHIYEKSSERIAILFDIEKMKEAASFCNQDDEDLYGKLQKLFESTGVVVAQITFAPTSFSIKNLYSIRKSSALEKFGPLSYEIVMSFIYPSYLRSDKTVSDKAKNVWDRMFNRTDVEHQPLKDWYPTKKESGSSLDYAYRKNIDFSTFEPLIEHGTNAIQEVADSLYLDASDVQHTLSMSAHEHFWSLYGK